MSHKPPALPSGGGNKENLLYINFSQERLMALLRYLAERHPHPTSTQRDSAEVTPPINKDTDHE